MNGVLVVDKPADFTSFDVVAVVRRLTKEKKIGHTGTLDPMATGVLPLLLGKAAKAESLLPDTDKVYRAGFRLGERRDTGDCTGRVLEQDHSKTTREQLKNALEPFRGEILQVPPMYSAVSVGGKRLYELAREGKEVERAPRPVTVFRLELEEYEETTREGILTASCSKGTYIRVLIEDIARAMGTCGTMISLRRTKACGFEEQAAIPLEQLRLAAQEGTLSELVLPTEVLFEEYPAVQVTPAQAQRFCNGGSLSMDRLPMPRILLRPGDKLQIRRKDGSFLGLASACPEENELRFLKLFAQTEEAR